MIVNLFVLVLLQMNAPLEIGGSGLPDSTCSRVVATPSGKTEPMIFFVNESATVFGVTKYIENSITINDGKCTLNETVIGEPCYNHTTYVNITINDATQFDTLIIYGEWMCIATFAPKCLFKPVEPGNVMPQSSFPFARFVKGNDSVTIKFSLKRFSSFFDSYLFKEGSTLCSWSGMIARQEYNSSYCKNFTENKEEGRLDYTLEYKRENSEEVTKFAFKAETSGVGVTVYWTKEGESPDIVECKKFDTVTTTSSKKFDTVTTTSSGRAIGVTFTVLFGIAQWIFK